MTEITIDKRLEAVVKSLEKIEKKPFLDHGKLRAEIDIIYDIIGSYRGLHQGDQLDKNRWVGIIIDIDDIAERLKISKRKAREVMPRVASHMFDGCAENFWSVIEEYGK